MLTDALTPDPGTHSVLATLRQRIVDGSLAPGQRLAEAAMAEALGVSRTPVRLAFKTLEQEGLLHKQGKRGLVVRAFSAADVHCAVEVRGVLEGLAARRLAQQGLPPALLAVLQRCIGEGQAVLAKGHLIGSDIARWSALNRSFHDTIVGAAGSTAIGDAIARNNHLPFASADSISIDPLALEREYQKLCVAQLHHELVLEALQQRESARVEMLMREHALIGLRYGQALNPAAKLTPVTPFTPVAG
jgi:GntR family transcriptional regulator of vanillate catabolism